MRHPFGGPIFLVAFLTLSGLYSVHAFSLCFTGLSTTPSGRTPAFVYSPCEGHDPSATLRQRQE